DREVNVRRPYIALGCRITAGLDGAEGVSSRGICGELRKALEVRVERRRVGVAWMTIFSCGVGLPDFDARVRDRLPRTGEDAPPHVDQFATRVGGAAGRTREVGGQIRTLCYRI